jgi:hypothetical protein
MLIGSQLFGHDTFNQFYFGISKFVINCRTLIMLVIHSCENFKEKKHTCVKIFLNILFAFEHWLIVTLKYLLKIYLNRRSGQCIQAVKTKAHKRV